MFYSYSSFLWCRLFHVQTVCFINELVNYLVNSCINICTFTFSLNYSHATLFQWQSRWILTCPLFLRGTFLYYNTYAKTLLYIMRIIRNQNNKPDVTVIQHHHWDSNWTLLSLWQNMNTSFIHHMQYRTLPVTDMTYHLSQGEIINRLKVMRGNGLCTNTRLLPLFYLFYLLPSSKKRKRSLAATFLSPISTFFVPLYHAGHRLTQTRLFVICARGIWNTSLPLVLSLTPPPPTHTPWSGRYIGSGRSLADRSCMLHPRIPDWTRQCLQVQLRVRLGERGVC